MKITELTVEQVNAVVAALEKQLDELRKKIQALHP